MDYENIKKLIDDMGCSKLESLEIDFPDGTKISMKKDSGKSENVQSMNLQSENIHGKNVQSEDVQSKNVQNMNIQSENAQSRNIQNMNIQSENQVNEPIARKAGSCAVESKDDKIYKYIKSPMVGTFYSKPSPDEASYINIGETIKKGSTTCIIEAMKLMNEIEAEFDGEVVEILKKDGEPVEYGENLIKLK